MSNGLGLLNAIFPQILGVGDFPLGAPQTQGPQGPQGPQSSAPGGFSTRENPYAPWLRPDLSVHTQNILPLMQPIEQEGFRQMNAYFGVPPASAMNPEAYRGLDTPNFAPMNFPNQYNIPKFSQDLGLQQNLDTGCQFWNVGNQPPFFEFSPLAPVPLGARATGGTGQATDFSSTLSSLLPRFLPGQGELGQLPMAAQQQRSGAQQQRSGAPRGASPDTYTGVRPFGQASGGLTTGGVTQMPQQPSASEQRRAQVQKALSRMSPEDRQAQIQKALREQGRGGEQTPSARPPIPGDVEGVQRMRRAARGGRGGVLQDALNSTVSKIDSTKDPTLRAFHHQQAQAIEKAMNTPGGLERFRRTLTQKLKPVKSQYGKGLTLAGLNPDTATLGSRADSPHEKKVSGGRFRSEQDLYKKVLGPKTYNRLLKGGS